MKAKVSKKQIMNVYNEHGLNGLYSFLRKNEIDYSTSIAEFGLNSSLKSKQEKNDWLEEKTEKGVFRFHYYSIGIKSRRSGYSYNIIRGIEITL